MILSLYNREDWLYKATLEKDNDGYDKVSEFYSLNYRINKLENDRIIENRPAQAKVRV